MNNDVELIPVKGVLPTVQAQSDNVIYVPQAHKNKAGIVKEGEGINIENGVVSLDTQTVEDMIDANKWVSYGFEQNLTEDEKGMARHNIGAGDNDFTGSWFDLANRPQETVDFAELERQKSKNLVNIISSLYDTTAGITTIVSNNKITINGTTTSGFSRELIITPIKCKANKTYSFSVNVIKGVYATAGTFTLRLGQPGGLSQGKVTMYGHTISSYVTYTPTEDIVLDRLYIVYNASNLAFSNFNCNLQFEENSVATSYQPYNGAIVHEKDIVDVEHIETIYDYSDTSKQTIDGVAYTNGIKFNKTTTYQLGDLSKYKGYLVTVKAYGSDNHVRFYIPKTPNVNSRGSFVGDEAYSSNDILFYGTVIINTDNQLIASYAASYNLTDGTITTYLDHDRYVVRKLEGVLL